MLDVKTPLSWLKMGIIILKQWFLLNTNYLFNLNKIHELKQTIRQ